MRTLSIASALLATAVLAACGDTSPSGGSTPEGGAATGTITVYAGRKGNVVDPIVDKFKKATGIEVVVVQDKSGTNLLSKIEAEADAKKSVADVLWVTDPAALGAASAGGHLETLPKSILDKAPTAWRADDGSWVGASGRTRVLAYNPELVKEADLPKTFKELTSPKWKGKIGWAPTNGSFQAFLTAMRGMIGDDSKVAAWLEAMKANEPKVYPKNTPIVKALADGEIALGLTNHYYVTRAQVKDANIPVKVARFENGDIGNLVMVTGAGVLKSSKNKDAARRFVQFLLEDEAQTYFTKDYCEYPVSASIEANERLRPLDELLKKAPDVDLSAMRDHAKTVEILKAAGLL